MSLPINFQCYQLFLCLEVTTFYLPSCFNSSWGDVENLKLSYTSQVPISAKLSLQFCTVKIFLDRGQHMRICPRVTSQPSENHPSWHLPWVTWQWSPLPTSTQQIYILISRLLSCDEPSVPHCFFLLSLTLCVLALLGPSDNIKLSFHAKDRVI